MHIIGVYNIKGGVGKTVTSVNIGYLAAQAGLRTLIWDLDPQAAASYYFRIKPKLKGSTKLIRGKRSLDDVIKGTDYDNLDMLPADFALRNMDLLLDTTRKPTLQLLKLLRPLAQNYDLVILDCPPSISLVSENIFRAADMLLVPTIPTTLSQRTLRQLLNFIESNGIKTPVHTFYSMVDRRKSMHKDIVNSKIDTRCGTLKSSIPYASNIERMGLERCPVNEFSARSQSAVAYEELWQEVLDLLPNLKRRLV